MRIRFSSRRNQVVGRFKKFLAGFSHQNAHSLAGIFGALKGILLALKGIPLDLWRVTKIAILSREFLVLSRESLPAYSP